MASISLMVALIVVLFGRWRTTRTIKQLDNMLTQAMEGNFTEHAFDETRLSALESRMVQYLAANVASFHSVQMQKDQISTLISDISHQTKTPVANLRLYAQLLEEQPLSPQATDCVRVISAQSEKLQMLIEALVKSSRLETGLLTLHLQEGEIAPVIAQAVEQYQSKALEKEIALTVGEIAGAGIFDPKWTEEAVCNLLDNAIKYTPAGGCVTVQVKNYEMFSAICVADTGPGIAEPEQAKIFGRFYRASNAYQTEGVGIGLYLVRQIASGQGGYIKVKSAPGHGSIFSLYLPRKNETRTIHGLIGGNK